jgi:hypothetical protein
MTQDKIQWQSGEHSNEPLEIIKSRESLDQLSHQNFHKKDSVSHSHLASETNPQVCYVNTTKHSEPAE